MKRLGQTMHTGPWRWTMVFALLLFTMLPFTSLARGEAQAGSEPAPEAYDDEIYDDETYDDETRVVAVDVMVSARRSKTGRAFGRAEHAESLDASSLEILVDGTGVRVIGTASAASETEREPWRIVIYFDSATADPASLRWAAETLGKASSRLVALGEVEVLFADDEVHQWVPPTRDPEHLEDALSRLAVEGLPGDDAIRALRAELLSAISGSTIEGPSEDASPLVARALVARAIDIEQRIIRSRHDLLLETLLARSGTGPRRAVIAVTDGWDADPAAFYRTALTGIDVVGDASVHDDLHDSALRRGSVGLAHHDTVAPLARVLAAYGWPLLAVVAPEPPPPPAGVYVGKWFIPKPSLKPKPGVPYPDQAGMVLAVGRKKYLDPERARAYLEVGRSLMPRGRVEDAIEAFEQAIFHFQNDHRTVDEQAAAWIELGRAHEQAGDELNARRAFDRAAALDPDAARAVGLGARLLTAHETLGAIADATAGALILSDRDLDRALEDLGHRVRVTFARAGPPTGTIAPLEIAHRGGLRLELPAWTRSATPPEVTAMRLRRLLASSAFAEELGADLPVTVDISGNTATIVVDPDRGAGSRYLRPTIAVAAHFDDPPRVLSDPTDVSPTDPEAPWRFIADLGSLLDCQPYDDSGGALIVLAIVDDLDQGTWGFDLIETERDKLDACP